MTENTETRSTNPPTTSPVARPPLRRSRTDRVLGGVAGGFGRWLGIDPVIVRVVLVVLAVFGGSGLLLYAIGWLFIPDEDATASTAETFIGRSREPGSTARTVLIIFAVVAGLIILGGLASTGPWGNGWGAGWLLLLVTGGLVLWLVNRPPSGTATWTGASSADAAPAGSSVPPATATSQPAATAPISTPAASTATAQLAATAQTSATAQLAGSTSPAAPAAETVVETGYAYGGQGGYPGYVAPVPAPTPAPTPRPRSYLGLATLSVAVIAMGVLGMLSVSGVATIPPVVTLSVGLGILGLGLLVGAFTGRARWLIALALPLLLVTALVAVIPANLGARFGNGVGERQWTPTTTAEAAGPFRLSIGSADLDLTEVVLPDDPSAIVPVQASLGIGDLRILVPEGVNVRVIGTVDLGEIDIEGLPRSGGQDREVTGDLPGFVDEASPTIELTADVALGTLEVSRA